MLRPRMVEAIRLLLTPGVLGMAAAPVEEATVAPRIRAVDQAVEATSLRLLPTPGVLEMAAAPVEEATVDPRTRAVDQAVEATSLRLLPTPEVLGTAVAIAVVIQAVEALLKQAHQTAATIRPAATP
jgi:hypothetical protein